MAQSGPKGAILSKSSRRRGLSLKAGLMSPGAGAMKELEKCGTGLKST
jgi:hypothetical protein